MKCVMLENWKKEVRKRKREKKRKKKKPQLYHVEKEKKRE